VATVQRYSLAVWSRDRAALPGWASLWTRVARVVIWSVRGLFVHKLSLQAAALAYYTLFSIVPVLVVVLWILKLFHLIPYLKPAEAHVAAVTAATPAAAPVLSNSNEFLREAARGILAAVDRAGRVKIGIVGLGALLYGVIKLIRHMEEAIDTIAGAGDRRPKHWRTLGYLALLVLPPALLILAALLRSLARLPVGSQLAHALSWLLAALPLLKSTLGIVIGLAVLCLGLAIFYASAARARIALPSTVVGAALSALALAAVLWAFARLQIGASNVGALESGMAVIPVFLLWSFTSWLVVLIGAQIAVAHELDSVLIHGARAWRLDAYQEQVAGVQMMVEATRRALSLRDGGLTANDMARKLRLLPESVRDVARRLLAAGMLRRTDAGDFRLACDPDRTSLRDVAGAIIGRPADDRAVSLARAGRSLREVVESDAALSSK
jgi:membrane protein